MDLDLDGKVAVVTGAGKGIGLAITKALAGEGARVVAGSRSDDALGDLDGVTAVALDLAAPEGPAALVQRALDDHGRIDVLVNNVGAVRLRMDGFLALDDDDFDWAMQMNFFTTLRATRAALGPMVEQGGGAVVNIASVNAFFQPDGGTVDYGAAKAAVVNLTKSLAQEFGPSGIRVNAISPGPVATDLWLGEGGVADTVATASGVDADTARENVIAGIGGFATGRFTTPEEVADLAVWLASSRTGNVTGTNVGDRRRPDQDHVMATELVYEERPAAGDAEGLLVLHHGRGADEHDLLGLAGALDPQRRLHVVTPGGPLTIPGWPGKHWYAVPRVGYPDPDTFRAAYDALAAFHDATWERTGIGPGSTVFGGFSMGSVMSYSLGPGRRPPGARRASWPSRASSPRSRAGSPAWPTAPACRCSSPTAAATRSWTWSSRAARARR